jgi:rare lipoprotein A
MVRHASWCATTRSPNVYLEDQPGRNGLIAAFVPTEYKRRPGPDTAPGPFVVYFALTNRGLTPHESRTGGTSTGEQMEGVKALVVLASIYYPGDGIVAKNNYQTSSGQRYDQSAPKCAALKWPLGTMLHLVHGRNNIDVTINDHGPYRKGRALDCTPAVDKALHLDGLGPVRVEAYPPLPKARPVEAQALHY